jgi:hypothetical protein
VRQRVQLRPLRVHLRPLRSSAFVLSSAHAPQVWGVIDDAEKGACDARLLRQVRFDRPLAR